MANVEQDDLDNDGVGDRCDCHSCQIEEFSSSGGLVAGVEAAYDMSNENAFDRWGNLTYERSQEGGSFWTSFYSNFAYDTQGNITMEQSYSTDYDMNDSGYEYHYRYDNYGNLVYSSEYVRWSRYEEDSDYSWSTYEYNTHEQLIKRSNYKYSNTQPEFWQEYAYDAQGRQSSVSIYSGDGRLSRQTDTSYNERGDIIAEITMDGSGKVLSGTRHEYRYDANGHQILAFHSDLNGQITGGWEYRYDEGSRLIWSAQRSQGGLVSWKMEYRYGPSGQIESKRTRNNHAAIVEAWDYRYDSAGQQLSETRVDANGKISSKKEWRYANGHTIMEISSEYYHSQPSHSEFIYEYDQAGQLIKTVAYYSTSRQEWTYHYDDQVIHANYRVYNVSGALQNSINYTTDYFNNLLSADDYEYSWHHSRAPGCSPWVKSSFCNSIDCFVGW
jgi:hypothetical protein